MIEKLLVANRGEIASRVMRTARAMGIATVAVFSDADRDAPFVADADEAVRLPGRTPAETYLRIDAHVDAARRTGAHAVHPGYGFLSENAAFAQACTDAGLVFVGPPARVIEAMGSKTRAKELMARAGVPVLPAVPGDEAQRALDEIGLPLLVKAVYGGGGRGMRVVRTAADLGPALEEAARESASAFGDGTVFVERFVDAPRHIEVQVVADAHGNVTHLFERECSIQRRHQKVIEEAPSPAVDASLREAICGAAVRAAAALGYVNAGTVEFVVDHDGRFFFLEVNTRLQVEHPVTELVTGLDLVELQLRIAEGEPLPASVLEASLHGHAIEARVYAEDVGAGYLPVSGPLHRFRFTEQPSVRVDAGYGDGSFVSTYYDAMLAKVVSWGPTRDDAARRLSAALAGAQIHGVATNRDLLVGVLRSDEFRAGTTDTAFLDRHLPSELVPAPSSDTLRVHARAAALTARAERRARSPLPHGIPPAWRNVGPALQRETFVFGDTEVVVDLDRDDDAAGDAEVRCAVHHMGDVFYVDSVLGSTALRAVPRFPLPEAENASGSLRSPLPGSVTRVAVVAGDRVSAGDVLLALEAMKMEHVVRAPHDGSVAEVRVRVGDQVESGTVLVVLDLDDTAQS